MRIKSKTCLALWGAFFMLAIPLCAHGGDGQIKIAQTPATTFPILIGQPGSYVLTSNLTSPSGATNVIEITADGVTLDMNGHTIRGFGGTPTLNGIYASNRRGITIMNGTIQSCRNCGIQFNFGLGHLIRNVNLNNNGSHGISAENARIINCDTSSNNGHGIDASYCTITNCIAKYNEQNGINASYSILENCEGSGNSLSGINASYSTVQNCGATNNGNDGIYGFRSTVKNCTVSENDVIGIDAGSSTITDCTAYQNGRGFFGNGSTIMHCTAYYNESDGFFVSNSIIAYCTAQENLAYGINAGSNCRIEGNNMRNNEYCGLWLQFTSGGNYAIKNTASGNTENFCNPYPDVNYMPTTGDNANYGF